MIDFWIFLAYVIGMAIWLRLVELTLLEAGYTVRLHGKKITKTETRKEMRK